MIWDRTSNWPMYSCKWSWRQRGKNVLKTHLSALLAARNVKQGTSLVVAPTPASLMSPKYTLLYVTNILYFSARKSPVIKRVNFRWSDFTWQLRNYVSDATTIFPQSISHAIVLLVCSGNGNALLLPNHPSQEDHYPILSLLSPTSQKQFAVMSLEPITARP